MIDRRIVEDIVPDGMYAYGVEQLTNTLHCLRSYNDNQLV